MENWKQCIIYMYSGAPNFRKTWGDNFSTRAPETSKFRGFKIYRNKGANIDEMYRKSMYDP